MGFNVSKKEAKKYGIARVQTGSGSKSSSTKVKTDNSAVKGYGEAIKQYQEMLPSLAPRYEALALQIDQQQANALEADTALAGTEQTDQKRAIAARGLEVNDQNEFYTKERNKLQGTQNTRATGIRLQFQGQKGELSMAQAQDERDIKSAIAGLLVGKGEAKYKAGRDAVSDTQWQQTFNFTKSEAAADRAIELRRLALAERESGSSGSSQDKVLNNDIATMVGTAYAGGLGNKAMIREAVAAQLSAKHPKKTAEIKKAMDEYFPDGWESRIYGSTKATVPSPAEINQGISEYTKQGATKEQIRDFIRANGANPKDYGID